MYFSRSGNPIIWTYKLSDTNIERVFDCIVDLGFKLSSNLNPNEQISMIFCKWYDLLCYFLKILNFLDHLNPCIVL